MKKIIAVLSLGFLLTACSSTRGDKQETTVANNTNRYMGAINNIRK